MFAGFLVFPFMSDYLVLNVGMANDQLPLMFIAGGVFTVIFAPGLAAWPRHGKLRVFRLVARAWQ